MFTVALVGADGAGKTTIAKMLLESFPLPMKYLYMGTSIQSSNFALPTSRLILYWKMRSYKKALERSGSPVPEFIPTHQLESRKVERGTIGATARMLNRLAEHWFRQMIAWSYQWRGYIVLYDRHFLFEFATRSIDTHRYNLRLSDRFHLWCVHHLYPRPDLVIFLDAPPEVLLSRKGEWVTEHLERHSLALLEQGKNMANFIRVDATQPLDKVYADVSEHILRFATST